MIAMILPKLVKSAIACQLMMFAAGAALFGAAPARAAEYFVSPVRASLSPKVRSELLNMSNTGVEMLRFQLSAYEWKQKRDGQPDLLPTEEVVFFPQLFNLQPGEKRKIRVGSIAPTGDVEKTYRLLVNQLPLPESEEHPRPEGVRLVTNMSIPIFVEPSKLSRSGELTDLRLSEGKLTFRVRNTGNVHFIVTDIRVAGLGLDEKMTFANQIRGWYVLSGAASEYEVSLNADTCSKSRMISVDARTEQTVLNGKIPVTPALCGRRNIGAVTANAAR
jgi:fimbrial chaperone protein